MKNSKIISILASAVSVGAITAGAFMFWKKKSQKEKSHLKHASADSKMTDHERQDEGAAKAKDHSKSSLTNGGETTNHSQEGKNDQKSPPHAAHHEEKEEKKDNHGKTAKKV